MKWLFYILPLLTLSAVSFGKEMFNAGLPVHNVFPTVQGILFPSMLTAAGVNPAALPQRGKSLTALGINYSPPPNGQDHQYSVDIASGNKTMGLGGGYLGSLGDNPSNGIFLGGGFKAASTSLGLGLRDTNINDGFVPQSDLGIIANGTDLSYGVVLYHMESSPQLDFGIGLGKDKNYNFEINVLLPPMATAFREGAAYTLTAATTVYAGIFGLSFTSSYTTSPPEVSQAVSLLVWVFKNMAVTIQYRSPNRSYYGLIATF